MTATTISVEELAAKRIAAWTTEEAFYRGEATKTEYLTAELDYLLVKGAYRRQGRSW